MSMLLVARSRLVSMACQTASSGSLITISEGLPAILPRTSTGNRPLTPVRHKPKVVSSPGWCVRCLALRWTQRCAVMS